MSSLHSSETPVRRSKRVAKARVNQPSTSTLIDTTNGAFQIGGRRHTQPYTLKPSVDRHARRSSANSTVAPKFALTASALASEKENFGNNGMLASSPNTLMFNNADYTSPTFTKNPKPLLGGRRSEALLASPSSTISLRSHDIASMPADENENANTNTDDEFTPSAVLKYNIDGDVRSLLGNSTPSEGDYESDDASGNTVKTLIMTRDTPPPKHSVRFAMLVKTEDGVGDSSDGLVSNFEGVPPVVDPLAVHCSEERESSPLMLDQASGPSPVKSGHVEVGGIPNSEDALPAAVPPEAPHETIDEVEATPVKTRLSERHASQSGEMEALRAKHAKVAEELACVQENDAELQAEDGTANKVIADLREQLDEQTSEKEVLEAKNGGPQKQYEGIALERELKVRLESAVEECDRLRKTIAEKYSYAEENVRLKKDLDETKTNSAVLQSDYDGVVGDLEFTESLLKERNEKVRSLEEKCAGLESELKSTKDELNGEKALLKKSNDAVEVFGKKCEDLRSELRSIKDELDGEKALLRKRDIDVEALKDKCKGLESDLMRTKSELDRKTSRQAWCGSRRNRLLVMVAVFVILLFLGLSAGLGQAKKEESDIEELDNQDDATKIEELGRHVKSVLVAELKEDLVGNMVKVVRKESN